MVGDLSEGSGGFSRENLKRHIWEMSQGADTRKTVPVSKNV